MSGQTIVRTEVHKKAMKLLTIERINADDGYRGG